MTATPSRDIFKLPHHCSYLSLGPEKGKDKTEPVPNVKWLFEDQGQGGGIIVPTSAPIPTRDTDQPPHRQAANYHKDNVADKVGEFRVTMEFPITSKPEPMVIEINGLDAKVVKRTTGGATSAAGDPAPRVGSEGNYIPLNGQLIDAGDLLVPKARELAILHARHPRHGASRRGGAARRQDHLQRRPRATGRPRALLRQRRRRLHGERPRTRATRSAKSSVRAKASRTFATKRAQTSASTKSSDTTSASCR